jgi:hypothetical protein
LKLKLMLHVGAVTEVDVEASTTAQVEVEADALS